MKNLLILPLVAALSMVSCKKEQQVENSEITTEETQIAAPVAQTPEEMIKEAQSKPLTTLAFSESHFEFGKIKKGDHVEHIYEVTNTGTNPLIISQVKPGCGCTAPDYTKTPILPGQKGKITLRFDSSNFDGLVNKQAEVFANVEKAPILLTFSADIQP